MPSSSPTPTEINLNCGSQELNIKFDDGTHFKYPCEYLRIFSPAAEIKAAREKVEFVTVKQDINIERISPIGGYAIQFLFNDNHDTVIYLWKTLYELGVNQEENWNNYVQQIKAKKKAQVFGERKIEILYFATLAQIIDQQHESLVLSDKIRIVNDLLSLLSERGELWEQQLDPNNIEVTINNQFVQVNHIIQDGDEIALTP